MHTKSDRKELQNFKASVRIVYMFANSLCIRLPSSERKRSFHDSRDLPKFHNAQTIEAPTSISINISLSISYKRN